MTAWSNTAYSVNGCGVSDSAIHGVSQSPKKPLKVAFFMRAISQFPLHPQSTGFLHLPPDLSFSTTQAQLQFVCQENRDVLNNVLIPFADRFCLYSSYPRKRVSSFSAAAWIPAFAGMTKPY
jgi:hypothetical protein